MSDTAKKRFKMDTSGKVKTSKKQLFGRRKQRKQRVFLHHWKMDLLLNRLYLLLLQLLSNHLLLHHLQPFLKYRHLHKSQNLKSMKMKYFRAKQMKRKKKYTYTGRKSCAHVLSTGQFRFITTGVHSRHLYARLVRNNKLHLPHFSLLVRRLIFSNLFHHLSIDNNPLKHYVQVREP